MTAITATAPPAARPSDARLLARWVAARVRMTARSPRALGFTFAFPLVLVTLFSAINQGLEVTVAGARVSFAQFYAPAIAVLSLTTACYTRLLVELAGARESGLFKRVLGTPLSPVVYLGSWAAGAILTGLCSVALLFAVAVPAFGVDVHPRLLPAAIVTAVLGAACLAALGLALGSVVRTAEQAMPLAQLTFLPISFISGIWFPLDGAPAWVTTTADLFPLKHIVDAFTGCFLPGTPHAGFASGDLAVIAAWGAAGLLVATRRLRREAAAS
jgi:ABC-2 type transport system permease protein